MRFYVGGGHAKEERGGKESKMVVEVEPTVESCFLPSPPLVYGLLKEISLLWSDLGYENIEA